MKQNTVGNQIAELLEKFPGIKTAEISYEGSGDSFNDFWNVQTTWKKKSKKERKEPQGSDMDDLLWYAIEHSEANFNNEGSEGEIVIDFEELSMTINNNYVVRETVPGESREFNANTLLTKED